MDYIDFLSYCIITNKIINAAFAVVALNQNYTCSTSVPIRPGIGFFLVLVSLSRQHDIKLMVMFHKCSKFLLRVINDVS